MVEKTNLVAQNYLGRRAVQFIGHSLEFFIVQELGVLRFCPRAIRRAERRVGSDDNLAIFAELHQLFLIQVRMALDLR
jgi:hypothetical protein